MIRTMRWGHVRIGGALLPRALAATALATLTAASTATVALAVGLGGSTPSIGGAPAQVGTPNLGNGTSPLPSSPAPVPGITVPGTPSVTLPVPAPAPPSTGTITGTINGTAPAPVGSGCLVNCGGATVTPTIPAEGLLPASPINNPVNNNPAAPNHPPTTGTSGSSGATTSFANGVTSDPTAAGAGVGTDLIGVGLPGSTLISGGFGPASAGLQLSPPPPVEQLSPLAGIFFGQAPYLWPLFVILDVAAAAAVAVVVRRTWSRNGRAN